MTVIALVTSVLAVTSAASSAKPDVCATSGKCHEYPEANASRSFIQIAVHGAMQEAGVTLDSEGEAPSIQLSEVDLAAGFDFKSLTRPSANPHIKDMINKDTDTIVKFIQHIQEAAEKQHLTLKILDVGGNSGKSYENAIAKVIGDYTSLDFVKKPPYGGNKKSVVGNIMKHNDDIADGSYQVVSALNVFEHLVAPWKAAAEMKRLTENGGFIVVMVPFSWRYHAYPLDTLRYTHTELRYLFESLGGVQTLLAAYRDYGFVTHHGHLAGHVDEPPDDHFQRQVEVVWIGRKVDGAKFDPESLDHYGGFDSPIATSLPDN